MPEVLHGGALRLEAELIEQEKTTARFPVEAALRAAMSWIRTAPHDDCASDGLCACWKVEALAEIASILLAEGR